MKKLLLIIVCLLFVCSCSNNEEKMQTPNASSAFTYDFVKLEKDLKELTYVTENNQELKLFGDGGSVDEKYISTFLQFDITTAEHFFAMRHDDESMAALLMIIKPINGNEDAVKQAYSDFLALYKSQFEGYSPEEYDLVRNYDTVDKNGYIIYIISYDNQSVLKVINDAEIPK